MQPVNAAFPGVEVGGAIDRALLSTHVLGKPEELKRLEAIVHPLVSHERIKFLLQAHETGADIIVLDIPLLFETGAEKDVDAVVVVTCPPGMQRQRVLGRPGMTAEKLDSILARQVPDEEKRKRADYVIDTSRRGDSDVQVLQVIEKVMARGDRSAFLRVTASSRAELH